MGCKEPYTNAEMLPMSACFHSGAFIARSLEKDGAGGETYDSVSFETPGVSGMGLALDMLRRLALVLAAEEALNWSVS
ncbi:hypothetical protein CFC21_048023 [Triticum aestivum]|uniref:Uncharacterized protein n=2 Tax=Triticum aestivum TaxID=4565 RepID=A0A9R1G0L7_WHEAT|nr:hypothetical protein CFC21_048019 [Triticum aestivum]KAF7037705.1 hypothetical protein CFC21_048023 [Triticum aestivum]